MARQVGVDPAAVYRHFADKAALLRAVAATGFVALADAMDGEVSDAGPDPTARYDAAARAYVRFAIDNPEYFRVMFSPYGAGGPDAPARGRAPDANGTSAYGVLVTVLEELRRAGRIDVGADAAAVVAWSGVHGLAHLLIEGVIGPDTPVDDHVSNVAQTVLRGFRRDR